MAAAVVEAVGCGGGGGGRGERHHLQMQLRCKQRRMHACMRALTHAPPRHATHALTHTLTRTPSRTRTHARRHARARIITARTTQRHGGDDLPLQLHVVGQLHVERGHDLLQQLRVGQCLPQQLRVLHVLQHLPLQRVNRRRVAGPAECSSSCCCCCRAIFVLQVELQVDSWPERRWVRRPCSSCCCC